MLSSQIMTASGVLFDPLAPRVEDIDIYDIAHALAAVNRFCGHTKFPVSVAQHSIYVSRFVPATDALHGLLHDASEAYISDIARPLKHTPAFAEYRIIEAHLQATIFRAFGIAPEMPESVIRADNIMLRTEQDQLMRGPDDPDAPRFTLTIRQWSANLAKQQFLKRFHDLTR